MTIKTKVATVLNGTFTTTGNGTTTPFSLSNAIVAYLNVTAASGTTPSLTVKFQDSPDGVTFYDIASGAFTAVTAAGTSRIVLPAGVGPFVRAVYTISGTTPSFTANVQIAGAE